MFKVISVQGFLTVPRINKNGKDLCKGDDASNFANTFMRRYAHKGVKDVMVFSGENEANICFTLTPYYPDKGNPSEAHWFHEVNLERVVENFHREFPYLESLTDV